METTSLMRFFLWNICWRKVLSVKAKKAVFVKIFGLKNLHIATCRKLKSWISLYSFPQATIIKQQPWWHKQTFYHSSGSSGRSRCQQVYYLEASLLGCLLAVPLHGLFSVLTHPWCLSVSLISSSYMNANQIGLKPTLMASSSPNHLFKDPTSYSRIQRC